MDKLALRCVIDTNVPCVANGKSTANPECVIHCTGALRDVAKAGHIVVDDDWRIVREYQACLNESGQPGPGDAFLKWVLTNLWNSDRCTQVSLTCLEGAHDDFYQFPESLRMIGFDPSDRKFVAVAVADEHTPEILQAFDSKWWGWRESLNDAGVRVTFLCEAAIAAKYASKFDKR